MQKEALESIVNKNSIQIGRNTTMISVLAKFSFLVLAAIIAQVVSFFVK